LIESIINKFTFIIENCLNISLNRNCSPFHKLVDISVASTIHIISAKTLDIPRRGIEHTILHFSTLCQCRFWF